MARFWFLHQHAIGRGQDRRPACHWPGPRV